MCESEQGQKKIPFCTSCCGFCKLQRTPGWQGHPERGPQPGVETQESQTLDSIKDPRQGQLGVCPAAGSSLVPKTPRLSAQLPSTGTRVPLSPDPASTVGKSSGGADVEKVRAQGSQEKTPEGRGWDKSLFPLRFHPLRLGKQL